QGGVGAEAAAEELPEPVRLLDRLAARQHGQRRLGAGAQRLLDGVERGVPLERLEAARPRLAQRCGDAVAGAQVAEREAALVAEPALIDLGMVPREDPLDLSLARRRADVAAHGAEPADG